MLQFDCGLQVRMHCLVPLSASVILNFEAKHRISLRRRRRHERRLSGRSGVKPVKPVLSLGPIEGVPRSGAWHNIPTRALASGRFNDQPHDSTRVTAPCEAEDTRAAYFENTPVV